MSNNQQRKTIGFITETTFENFHSQLIEGINKCAQENDVNIVTFSMESVQTEDFYEDQFDYILNIARNLELDGFMFLGWMFTIVKNLKESLKKIKSIGEIPILSLGAGTQGVPSVCMDGKAILEVLEHLTQYHHCKRVVYIQPFTPDERYLEYETFMKEHGLFDPELVIRREELEVGKEYYAYKRAERACEILFDEKKIKFDAAILMYSHEAAFFMEECIRRGYRIPGDIAVTGWEDGDRSKYADPPITSVYFPYFEIGYAACNNMIKLIRGEKVPLLSYVPAKFNIRSSCGCGPTDVFNNSISLQKKLRNTVTKESLMEHFRSKTDFVFQILNVETLIGLLFHSEPVEYQAVNAYINSLLYGAHTSTHVVNSLNLIMKEVLEFRNFILNSFDDHNLHERADTFFFKILISLWQKSERELGFNEALKQGSSHLLQEINQHIVTTFHHGRLWKVLNDSLSKINVRNCHIFQKPIPSSLSPDEELTFCYCDGSLKEIVRNNKINFKDTLFHDQERRLYYFFILHIKDGLLGYIFIEPRQIDERIYFTLSVQLSSALYESNTITDLRSINAHLESAKNEITNNLAVIQQKTAELEESNLKLSQLDKTKNDFIANVTHDFRSPLMIILNLADLTVKYFSKMDEQMVKQRLMTVLNASIKLKDTIDRLLEIAKMDAHGLKLYIKNLPLCAYIENVTDFYKSAVIASGIRITCELPELEIDDFYTDADKLDEILNNIISNAIKFVDTATGEITIKVIDEASCVRIIVEDNGIGIPQDKLESIFQRFEQLERDRYAKIKGSGIGLAFARQMTKFLNGSLDAFSEGQGKGARFTLEFPKGIDVFKNSGSQVVFEIDEDKILNEKRFYFKHIIESDLREAQVQKNTQVFLHQLNADHEYDPWKALILIVDDNLPTTEIVREYLSQAGYRNFVTAFNGRDGIEAVYKYKPDLIISDYNMPLMRGDELHDQLLSNPDLKHTPIIFLSAIVDKKLIMERKKKGAIVYLQKPIDERELLVNVEHFLVKYMEFKVLLLRSSIDELTGLANRHTIIKFLRDYLMLRVYRPLSVIMMDVDHFKSVNDTYGHQTGDGVLVEAGKCLQAVIRSYDKAGRFGGEEFLIVLPETSLADAAAVAEKLKNRLSGLPLSHDSGRFSITASFGVASLIDNEKYICKSLRLDDLRSVFEINDKENTDWQRVDDLKNSCLELLIKMADQALYRAKMTICAKCGFKSGETEKFKNNICPECGSDKIVPGRNKVISFSSGV